MTRMRVVVGGRLASLTTVARAECGNAGRPAIQVCRGMRGGRMMRGACLAALTLMERAVFGDGRSLRMLGRRSMRVMFGAWAAGLMSVERAIIGNAGRPVIQIGAGIRWMRLVPGARIAGLMSVERALIGNEGTLTVLGAGV